MTADHCRTADHCSLRPIITEICGETSDLRFYTSSLRSFRRQEWSAVLYLQRMMICGEMNYGTFVPTYFRSQERKYHRWNFRSLVLSLPGNFVPWIFRSLELSLPWTFAPGSESYMELSLPGTFAPRNFRSMELSPLYQYEKRITVALSTKECSSLPTNVSLQSVLTYRHVRRTYDAGWHGIGKDYEVVIERIDKLQL